MALPWLIGGAIALLVGTLASSDSSSNDREQEARRREEAERERAENERNKKLVTARENFAMRGESMGSDIAQSLQGWIEVKFEQSPAFSAQLDKSALTTVVTSLFVVLAARAAQQNSKGDKIDHAISNEKSISALLPSSGSQFDKIKGNLKIYSDTYSVKLKQGAKLVETGKEIETIESELKQIRNLKAEMSRLQIHLSTQV